MDHPLLNAFLMIFWFFLWIMWLMLLFRIIADIFEDHQLSGVAKTAWLIFVILLPFIGVFVYLIVRGPRMAERAQQHASRSEAEFREYVRHAAGTSGTGHADELTKLSALRADGTITDAEFQQAKTRLLAS